MVAIVCRLTGLAVNNIVVLSPSAVPVLYAIPLLTATAGALLLIRGPNSRGGPSVAENVADRLKTMLARMASMWPQRGLKPAPAPRR